MGFEKIVDTVEKIFRYFLTGISFAFIYHLSNSNSLDIPIFSSYGNIIYIYILAVGMIIYAIHRIFYWLTIDYFLFLLKWSPLSNYEGKFSYVLGEFLKNMLKEENNRVKNYLFYRFSIIHFGLILSEIIFVIYPFSNDCSILIQNNFIIIPSSIFLYLLSLFNYILMNKASKKVYE